MSAELIGEVRARAGGDEWRYYSALPRGMKDVRKGMRSRNCAAPAPAAFLFAAPR